MENNHTIVDLMNVTMAKIHEMVDVDTIVGNPVSTPDGTTVIPVSKVTFGFGAGGSDYTGKNALPDAGKNFGGGSGAGVSITPVSFLIVAPSGVKLLPVAPPAANTLDRIIETAPSLIERIVSIFKKNKDEDED